MKGIILAGGSGTRLYPITKGVSKQLLPVYDKPMIYYPLSVLMLAGITEILVITTPDDQASFQRLLGDGTDIGIKLSFIIQPSPDGLAQAFILGKDFIGDDDVCLVLGDNIFYGHDLKKVIGDDDVCLVLGDNIFYGHDLKKVLSTGVDTARIDNKATVFGYRVADPERYGVTEFDDFGNVVSIEEKPNEPKSNYAVTGLYFYPNDVINKATVIKPSHRGELEITTVNQLYLDESRLKVELLGRGYAWLDTGTHDSLLEASQFIETIEKRQGLKVACIEEIAFEEGYISKEQLIALAQPLLKNQYGQYLLKRAEEGMSA